MQVSRSDARTSPQLEIPRLYNAACDLLERNLGAGRGDKLAYIDDRGRFSYGGARAGVSIAPPTRCSPSGSAARAARAARPARQDRFPGGVSRRDQGGHRPGRRQHAARRADYRVHAGATAAPAPLVISAPLLPAFGRPWPTAAARTARGGRRRRVCHARAAPGGAAGRRQRGAATGRHDPRRRLLLALLVRLDRRAQGHRASARQPDADRGALRAGRCSGIVPRATWCSRRPSCSSPMGWATR